METSINLLISDGDLTPQVSGGTIPTASTAYGVSAPAVDSDEGPGIEQYRGLHTSVTLNPMF